MVKELWPGRHFLYGTKSSADNSKSNKQELSSLFMAHRLNVMHAPVKFHKYNSYGLGVMARVRIGVYIQEGPTGITLNALPLFFE